MNAMRYLGRISENPRTHGEMLSELRIRFQPPKPGRGKNKMRCALATQSLKIGNRLLAVLWIAAVNPILLEKMPAFALRIIEYGWIATVHRDNQCIARRKLV